MKSRRIGGAGSATGYAGIGQQGARGSSTRFIPPTGEVKPRPFIASFVGQQSGSGASWYRDWPSVWRDLNYGDDVALTKESWPTETIITTNDTNWSDFYLCGDDLGNWGRIDETVARYMGERSIPSGSVSIFNKDGALVYAKGFTNITAYEAAREMPEQWTCPRSLFRIASVSKILTAIGVLRCEQDGLLPNGLDTTIGDLGLDSLYSWIVAEAIALDTKHTSLRSTRDQFARITIRQLLTHLSGICEDRDRPAPQPQSEADSLTSCNPISWYKEDEMVQGKLGGTLPVTRNQILACVASTSISAPGLTWQYANHNFMLLARVIEVATDREYEAWMKETIMAPVGAYSSMIGEADRFSQAEVPYYSEAWPWEGDEDGERVSSAVHDRQAVERSFGATVMDESGRMVYLPRGNRNIRASDGGSGWVSSAYDLCRVLRNLFLPDTNSERVLLDRDSVGWMCTGYADIWKDDGTLSYQQGLGFKVRWHRDDDWKDRGHTGHLEGSQARLYHRGTFDAATGATTTADGYGLVALFNRHAEAWEAEDGEDEFYATLREYIEAAVVATGTGDLWNSSLS